MLYIAAQMTPQSGRSSKKSSRERRDSMREACRRWRKTHPERQRAATYSWRQRNRAKWNRYQRKWRRAHPARARANAKNAWMKTRGNPERYAGHLASGSKWRLAHPEKERVRHRKYRAQNLRRMRKYQREWMKKWYRNHREEAKQLMRAQRAKNIEHWRARDRAYYRKGRIEKPTRYARKLAKGRAWAKRNRAKLTYWTARYRARKLGARGAHSLAEWVARVDLFSWRCFHCGTVLDRKSLTKDHLVPLSRGGSENAENLVPACKSCNSAKRDRLNWRREGAQGRAPSRSHPPSVSIRTE